MEIKKIELIFTKSGEKILLENFQNKIIKPENLKEFKELIYKYCEEKFGARFPEQKNKRITNYDIYLVYTEK